MVTIMSVYSQNIPPSLKGAIEWMLPYIKDATHVLDVGCSTGYFGKYLIDTKKCKVYGIEISDDVKKAQKVLDGTYTFDLDGEWPPEVYERKYDYIFFGDVLEHLKDSERVLKKTAQLLKPRGKVFVSVPNIAHISTRLELLNGGFEYEPMGILDKTHLKYFTLESFKGICSSAGYNVESVDYTVNDYPRRIISKLVNDAGLQVTDKFWKVVESTEARAFQYKFVLTRSKSVKKPKFEELPLKPEKFRDSYILEQEDKAKNLLKHAKEQARIIEILKSENEIQRRQLEKLHAHTIVKVLGRAKSVKNKITSKLK